jgi:serine/threonine-protein kinase
MPTSIELKAGEAFGRYELLLPVAKGGMSRVWAARLRGTRGFQKLVAIKTLFADGPEKQRLEPMLLAEARLAAQIQHPNVAQYLDLGERDGVLFVVMEWVDGESLTSVIRKANRVGRIPMGVSAQIVAQACNGLHGAHELRDAKQAPLGLVHCDVSPHNLMIGAAGGVKLIDFGIAKAVSGAPMEGQEGLVAGKLAFMAPEQALGHQVDRRADIFSLGIVLYLLTTGRHPFGVGTPMETLQRIVKNAPVIPPRAADPHYPAAVERVVMRALAHERENRFETAAEMLYELSAATELAHEMEVGAFVQETCSESLLERRLSIEEALARAAEREGQGEGAAPCVSVPPESAPVPDSQSQHISTTAPAATDVFFVPEPKVRRSWAPLYLGVLVALGLVVAIAFQRGHLERAGVAAALGVGTTTAPRSLPPAAPKPRESAAAQPSAQVPAPGTPAEESALFRDGALPASSAPRTKAGRRPRVCAPGTRCVEPARGAPKPSRSRDQYGI